MPHSLHRSTRLSSHFPSTATLDSFSFLNNPPPSSSDISSKISQAIGKELFRLLHPKNTSLESLKNQCFSFGEVSQELKEQWKGTNEEITLLSMNRELCKLSEFTENLPASLFWARCFHGEFDPPFNPEKSYLDSFFCGKNNPQEEVSFMTQKATLPFSRSENLKCSLIQIPYNGLTSDFQSMQIAIVLPDQDSSLEELLSFLNQETFLDLVEDTKEEWIELSLPSFEVNQKEGAIRVNEYGPETYISPSYPLDSSSDQPPPRPFKVNRPFVFAVKTPNQILQVGYVQNILPPKEPERPSDEDSTSSHFLRSDPRSIDPTFRRNSFVI